MPDLERSVLRASAQVRCFRTCTGAKLAVCVFLRCSKAPSLQPLRMPPFSGGGGTVVATAGRTMRVPFLLIAVLFATAARGETKLPGGADACVDCHNGNDAPAVNVTAFGQSVHADKASCTDCHAGYAMGPHDAELPALGSAEQAIVARLSKARWPEAEQVHKAKAEKGEAKELRVTAPRAYLACAGCHDMEHPDAMAGWQRSVHSKWLREDTKVAGPTCTSCHGSIHALKKLAAYAPTAAARAKVPADRREIAKRCEACHGNEEFAKAAGVNPEAAVTYHDSMHGRL